MNRLSKIAVTGLAVMIALTLLLHGLAGVSLAFIAPFFLPWTVLLLIGLTNRKR